jgi:hypothetical protein
MNRPNKNLWTNFCWNIILKSSEDKKGRGKREEGKVKT